jgi:hypothetical protein
VPPNDPGDYLFYGDPANTIHDTKYFKPRFEICRVAKASNGIIVRIIGGSMLLNDDGRDHGVWRPLFESIPDLAVVKSLNPKA